MQHIWAIIWPYGGAAGQYCQYHPMLYILERFRRADVKLLLMRNAATYRFRDIRGELAKIGVWMAKNGPPQTLALS